MKKRFVTKLPFLTMPIFIPIYFILDNLILVDIFGCGCVPTVAPNMLNIPFNANDLKFVVFVVVTILLSVWSICIAQRMDTRIAKFKYCLAVLVHNVILAFAYITTFMWA